MKHLVFEGPDSGTKRVRFESCPLCSWSHKLYKTGVFVTQKGKRVGEAKSGFGSGKKDLETAPFVAVRDTSSSSCTNDYPQRVELKAADSVF